MKLTLSFDNGPDPEITPRVLDVLARRDARAHFFVLGQRVERPEGRALVERARDEGHLVGNHSYSHAIPLGSDPRPDAVLREIAATEALLEPIVPGARRFRPFGGGGVLGPHLFSARAIEHLRAHRFTCVLWNSVPRDWVDPDGWARTALADLASRPHTLLVLHDLPNACLAALDAFIEDARAAGAELALDLPPECVPMIDGRVVGDLAPLVRAEGRDT
jgi:peptidoglycan/xylan/chitin deacetylase (PgdA/CDA1 family)